MVDLTLPLKSEVKEVNPTLPLESEFEVFMPISSPPDPTLSPESVKVEVVASNQYSSCPSLPFESELKPVEAFVVSSDCSVQGEILSISTEPSPSTKVISFDWSNLT